MWRRSHALSFLNILDATVEWPLSLIFATVEWPQKMLMRDFINHILVFQTIALLLGSHDFICTLACRLHVLPYNLWYVQCWELHMNLWRISTMQFLWIWCQEAHMNPQFSGHFEIFHVLFVLSSFPPTSTCGKSYAPWRTNDKTCLVKLAFVMLAPRPQLISSNTCKKCIALIPC